jgi:hypothetical protein
MANDIKVNLAVSDGGTLDDQIKKARVLLKELNAIKTVSKMQNTGALSQGRNDMTDVGANRLAKGIQGATGAAGRDFAKQAQGLGGLVHVYATFAANIFAVSAAFTALSKAADYDNMIKGLDQLGASSGKNLGTMAKNVTALTDGAISLKESMSAVAQASSAGMSGQQIERMALVAKKASQALGRDMTDSINRLSRGITKMEPELLDELGIFTRVDRASADYARSVGKSVNALTDFEKRQAFANAALTEAEKKFGAINLSANSFSKLQASITDILYQGGTLLNKVLNPIAEILSNSPTALAAGLLGIVGILVKQALPAIANMRQGLAETAELTGKIAANRAAQAKAGRTGEIKALRDSIELEADKRATAMEELANKANKKSFRGLDQNARSVLDEVDAKKITDAQIKALEAKAGAGTKTAKMYGQIAEAAKKAKEAEDAWAKANQALKTEEGRKLPWYSTEAINKRLAEVAQAKATRAQIISSAADEASVTGFTGGMATLASGIEKAKKEAKDSGKEFGKFQTALAYTQGTAAVVATKITSVVSSLGAIGMVIGVVIGAFELVYSWLSKNSKQLVDFDKASETLTSSIDGLGRTLDYLASKSPLEQLSVDSINARATAIYELSNSFESLYIKFKKLQNTETSWLDDTVDWVKKIGNWDVSSTMAKDMSQAAKTTLDAITDPKRADKLRASLEDLVGSKTLSAASFKKLINKNDEESLKKFNTLLKENGIEVSNAASKVKEYTDQADQTIKTQQSLLTSFMPSDNLSKFAMDQIKMAEKLASSLSDTESSMSALYETMKDSQRLSILPEKALSDLMEAAPAIRKFQEELGTQQNIKDIQQKALTLEEKRVSENGLGEQYQGRLKAIRAVIAESNEKILTLQDKATQYVKQTAAALYDSGAQKLTLALSNSLAKAALEYQAAIAGVVGGEEGAKLAADIAKQQVAAEISLVKALYAQSEQVAKNTMAIEIRNNRDTSELADKKLKAGGLSKSEELEQTNIRNKANSRVEELTNALAFVNKGGKSLASRLRADKESADSSKDESKISASNALRSDVGSLSLAQLGRDNQLAALSSKMQTIEAKKQFDLIEEQWKVISKTADEEKDRLATQLRQDELTSANSITLDQDLETRIQATKEQIRAIDAVKAEYAILQDIQKLEKYKQVGGKAEYADNRLKTLNSNLASVRRGREDQEAADAEAERIKSIDLVIAKSQKQQALLEVQKRTIEVLATMERATTAERAKAEQDSFDITRRTLLLKIEELEEEKKKSKDAATILQAELRVEEAIAQFRKEAEASLYRQLDLQKKLVDEGGKNTMPISDMVGLEADRRAKDFRKNLKSSVDYTFDAVYAGMDAGIDELFTKMQQGQKIAFKDIVNTVRNAMSNVFADAAKEYMKMGVRDMISGMFGGPKTYEQTMTSLTEKIEKNTSIMASKTGSTSTSKLGGQSTSTYTNPIGPASAGVDPKTGQTDWEKQAALDEAWLEGTDTVGAAASTSKDAAGGFLQSASGMWSAVKDFATGNATFSQTFGRIIDGFGNMMPSLFTGIYGAIASAMGAIGGGGGGGGGGIFGTLLNLGVSYLTGGFGGSTAAGPSALAMGTGNSTMAGTGGSWLGNTSGFKLGGFAKGGAFEGAEGLSKYSNSIVSSPISFAFAKGGVPNMGIAGESGPEAIIPLKRDATGNLGIRGGGEMVNNIDINISIEGGSEKDNGGGMSKDMAGLLGNSIKAAVTQELIKQSRPGGLLAR